jgi:hypothetical protein
MEDVDLTDGDLHSDKIEINLHMLGALMLNGVGGEVHGTDVVVVDKGAPRRWTLELMEQLLQPHRWRRHGTQPLRWNRRQQFAVWLIRTSGCPPETPHSLK